jgi:glycerol kinase
VAEATQVLAIDEGTTGVRALVVNRRGEVQATAYEELAAAYPRPGWVEIDAGVVWTATRAVCRRALQTAGVRSADLAAIGISNQRSTTLVWERSTGCPLAPAIIWQDSRTEQRAAELLEQGIWTSAMASATKLEWLLRTLPDAGARARRGELCFGTIDSWLLWNLTDGGVHVTDASNASCTGLYDPLRNAWDAQVLEVLDIPAQLLPSIRSSSEIYGHSAVPVLDAAVPVAGIAGDQQAAMFGELATEPGAVKVTYGTSAMVDVNTGDTPVLSSRGAFPLILWERQGQRPFCLEGQAITAGAAVQWLRDGLGVLGTLAESAALAQQVPDSGGVWAVPAFQGLGTPYMDIGARAVIGGLSRGSSRAHVVRAVLEGVAHRTREVLDTLLEDASVPMPPCLRVDGGAAENDFLLQHLADIIGTPVERPRCVQASALGAAYLAGLAAGVWSGLDELRGAWQSGGVFEPCWSAQRREDYFGAWRTAVGAARERIY